MIVLTLLEGDDVFINPPHILAVVVNDEGSTDVVCDSQTVFVVKETPLAIYNMIKNQIN
jgi:uncharacterized protein YlzI (FlbEa/FlbD family)